ncbi:hypothetical protein LSCM1_03395 [Leishmania martiniquensis]|uniref:Uncharacterized protein n=1 Tax=Leishmania martiniquensis TaxID=1580590 RepID=A0A836KJK9_9TRYP|nr:hypothetical protein LSCM1_03395 [Leishmania martiniquensis]
MHASTVTAALQDALEKGDIVELEQAITAAEDSTGVSAYTRKTSSSSLANLIARAKNMYRVHMNACKGYVVPLRKACRELSERGIFEALVKARSAPDEVQLCMYTDLCNAESLRREIVEAQRRGARLLSSTSAQEVDDFLTECSPFLEDHTVLALVQRREDLLRDERRRQFGGPATTPLRASTTKFVATAAGRERNSCKTLESRDHSELKGEGVSLLSRHQQRPKYRSCSRADGIASYGGRGHRGESSEAVPRSSSAAGAVYPALQDALKKSLDGGLQRTITEGASPWMQTMRALCQQACGEAVRQEHERRRRLEDREVEERAELYRNEMLSRVQRWAAEVALFRAGHEQKAAPEGDDRDRAAPRRPSSPMKSASSAPPLDACASPAAAEAVAGAASSPATRACATHSLAAYTLRPAARQLTPRRPSRTCAEAAVGGSLLGSAVGHRNEELHTPRIFRDTPNISPIKDVSTASGAASLSEQDQLYQRGSMKSEWEDGLRYGSPRGKASLDDGSAVVDTFAGSSMSAVKPPSLTLRRIQARLRAVLQEEEIHRRDIEGTEDFDRSVFLFPVSARIALLRHTEAQRTRIR